MARACPLPQPPRRAAAAIPPARCAGLSLVELMVAIVIGLMILAAMLTAYTSGSSSSTSTARAAEVQASGRYAADLLRREIQHAGYMGINYGAMNKDGSLGTNANLCGVTGFASKLEEPIWGSNDANSLTCIDNTSDYLRGDVLVLRRAGLTEVTPAAGNLYVRTEFMKSTVYYGATAPTVLQNPAFDYPVVVDVYYVSRYSTTAGDGIPSLARMSLSGTTMTRQVITTGIENMQVQYGVSSAGTVRFVDATGVGANEWASVVAVRLWLLARSTDAEYNGYQHTARYDMGDVTYPSTKAPDNYVRRVFPLVVNLRN